MPSASLTTSWPPLFTMSLPTVVMVEAVGAEGEEGEEGTPGLWGRLLWGLLPSCSGDRSAATVVAVATTAGDMAAEEAGGESGCAAVAE